jgi:NADPH-dependent ferric siderophore reductase
MMTTLRLRREPPRFRRLHVRRVDARSPYLRRVTFGGADLDGLDPGLPAASVRLLLPSRGTTDLELPSWNGNEFRLADGSRPVLRTYTPLRLDPDALELDLDIVLHEHGAASAWAEAVHPGDPAAVSGTGRGYAVDPDARSYLLLGDETAIPAVGQLLAALPAGAVVEVQLEIRAPDAEVALPAHPGARVTWLAATDPPGGALVAALEAHDLGTDERIWAAGEAAAMHRIRRHLLEARGLPRSHAHVRGYWKRGRSGDIAADG